MPVATYLAALLAAFGSASGHLASSPTLVGTQPAGALGQAPNEMPLAKGSSSPDPSTPRDLGKRGVQVGGRCGTTGGHAVCAAGLCCSETGLCASDSASCVAPGCQLGFGPNCDGNKSPSGRDTSSTPRPLFSNLPYGVELKHCQVSGTVALTFDDGPYIYTTEVLDILKRNGVKATFFIVGANGGKGQINDPASGYAPIVKRMWDENHQIASHTWSHQDMTTLTKQQRRDQIVKNEIAISSILGVIPTYFRPPYSNLNADVLSDLKGLGYHVTNYDVDTRDWEGNPTYSRNTYLSALSSRNPASSAFLCIAHDIQQLTVRGGLVQYMIDEARRLNYKLDTLGACMGEPKRNWYRDAVTGQAYDTGSPAPKSVLDGSQNGNSSVTNHAGTASTPEVTPTSIANPHFGAGTGGDATATPKASGATGFQLGFLGYNGGMVFCGIIFSLIL